MVSPTAPSPRYRYFEEAPSALTVQASELLEKLPARHLSGRVPPAGTQVDLPCNDLFRGNTPRLSLATLHRLLPDSVLMPREEGGGQGGTGDQEAALELPPGWLACRYRLVTRREELPKPLGVGGGAGGLEESPSGEDSGRISDDGEPPASDPAPLQPAPMSWKNVVITPVKDAPKEAKENEAAFPAHPALGEKSAETVNREEAIADREGPGDARILGEPPGHGPAEGQGSGKTLALERLWKLDPGDLLEDPASLQALFMTEERLTLERVVTLAGELPGLRACVLAHGDRVICASRTASGIDLQTLSGQAMTMLEQIRESSSQLGLGAVPAVTLHAEQGILSFLHKGELCLLVLHADRGFVPGVRERLQDMMGHLADARPALPDGETSRSRDPKSLDL